MHKTKELGELFLSQFSFICLLGIQTINVAHKHIGIAMVTSLLLSICGFFTYSRIAEVRKAFTPVWYVYICAGPLGIATSIMIQPFLERIFT